MGATAWAVQPCCAELSFPLKASVHSAPYAPTRAQCAHLLIASSLLPPIPPLSPAPRPPFAQSPNSYFMDVRCPGCFVITTVFSHATTQVQCDSCALMLCQSTGGKARLTEGCSFRRKQD